MLSGMPGVTSVTDELEARRAHQSQVGFNEHHWLLGKVPNTLCNLPLNAGNTVNREPATATYLGTGNRVHLSVGGVERLLDRLGDPATTSGVVGFGSDGSWDLVPAEDSLMRAPAWVAGDETVCLTDGSGQRSDTATAVMRHPVLG